MVFFGQEKIRRKKFIFLVLSFGAKLQIFNRGNHTTDQLIRARNCFVF